MTHMLWALENPAYGALHARPFMRRRQKYRYTLDYCAYKTLTAEGEWQSYPYRKPTSVYTNIGFEPRRCTCEGQRHFSSLVGDKARGARGDHGQGAKARLSVKHTVPTQLLCELLANARRMRPDSKFVLDLFAGTQSVRRACDELKLKYVSVDIAPKVRTPEGSYVTMDIVQDLQNASLDDLITRSARLVGEDPKSLLLVWLSPPCTTYSCANTLKPPAQRYRDWSHPERPPITEAARRDDELVEHWINQLKTRQTRSMPCQRNQPQLSTLCATVAQETFSDIQI